MADDKNLNPLENAQNSVELTNLAKMSTEKPNESSSLSASREQTALDAENLTLDEWVDSIFEADKNNDTGSDAKAKEDFRPTLNLGRFGLKTPEDVKKFLHSPAGEAVIGEMGAKLSHDKAIQEELQFEQREHRLLINKIQATLFMWYLESKAHASDKVKEAIMQQNEKAIENAKTHTPEAPSTVIPKAIQGVDNTLDSYLEVLQALQAKKIKLDGKMAKLENEAAHLEAKYDIYDANLALFEQELDANPELSLADIELKLKALTGKMKKYSKEIGRLLNENKEDEATALLHALTGLKLQAACWHDMIEVHNNNKYFADIDGNPSSIKDAYFTLNRDQKLVKDDQGVVHLIKATDDSVNEVWDAIKRDPQAKAAAHSNFQALKQNPEAMAVKKVVQHNKVMENAMHSQEVATVSKLQEDTQAHKLLIGNQISQLTADRGNLLQQANQDIPEMEQMRPALTPRPTPTNSAPTAAKASQATPTDIFKSRLQELKQATHVSREDLINLANQAPGKNRIAANAYLQMEFVNMPRTGNIPFQTMQSMLKNLERFGIDSTKPGVTKITNPGDLKQLNEAKQAMTPEKEDTPEERPVFSPSPFSTNPFK
ncbi:hypothetical protein [uncultured Legionella sp.]|uniref:hypothetical protein n=1 Tax=uncultured Legionella sp. TaxID=210934 RepID=UPI002608B38F|nr:hypothetical protein [uncultured Legionella sp.]